MQFASINQIITHYYLSGNPDGTPVVFVNSLGSDLRLWEPLVSYFEDAFAVVRYDKRGHGLSSSSPAPYHMTDFSRDLAALLGHLEIRELILVGISVGGQIAMQFALENPGALKALILADTAPKIGTAEYWAERIRAIQEKGLGAMAQQILPRWFAEDYPREYPAAYQGYLHMLARTPQDGYIGTCAALGEADLSEAVKDLQTETLVLCGADDQATSPQEVERFASTLPSARFALIPGAGHHPCIENPAAMAETMKQFIHEVAYA